MNDGVGTGLCGRLPGAGGRETQRPEYDDAKQKGGCKACLCPL